MRRLTWLEVAFALCGGVLLVFIGAPLLRLLLAQTPATLWVAARQPEIQAAIWLSLTAALTASLLGAALGVPLAYLVARDRLPAARLIESVVNLPLAVPHTVAGIALLFVFGREGLFGIAFYRAFGLQFWGTFAGIVVAMLFVSVPFLFGTARATFDLIDPGLEKVARTLGAPPAAVFWRITLPGAARGIARGAVAAYARSLSEFAAVALLAYYPRTAPVLVYQLYLESGLRASSAAAVLLLLVTLGSFTILLGLVGPGREWRHR